MKLTENFSSEEITGSHPWDSFTQIQQLMIIKLTAFILQPIRNLLKVSMTITSGVRFPEDYDRLIKAGYHPSETSDHFYGFPVPISNPEKIKKFGLIYTHSVGATDFKPKMPIKDAFEIIKTAYINNTNYLRDRVGQIIIETGNGMEWIHVSNNPRLIYSEEFCARYLNKTPLLASTDAGQTYQNA